MKVFEESKQGGYMSSIKGFFGFGKKTPEEEEEERRQMEEMRLKIEQETLQKI
jgi:hypothetical protein